MEKIIKSKKLNFKPIGMRIIKSSIAVFLCFLVYYLNGEKGVVFYSQLAALWCIQPYVDTSLKNALQRTVGTFVGALFAALIIPLFYYVFHGEFHLLQYIIISVMIIPVIYLTVITNQKNASFFSCVVFLSIVVLHIEDGNPYRFVRERIVETLLGILIGVCVNSFHLPHKKRYDILFMEGLDESIINSQEDKLSNFSIVELNQMLDSGLKFTIATQRTPASLMEYVSKLHINLPIIVMNGAALYDFKTSRYLRSFVISYDETMKLAKYIRACGMQCFINVIMEDTLIIYHQKLKNEAEKSMFRDLYYSPHRNFLGKELPEGTPSVYMMLLDETDKIDSLYKKMNEDNMFEGLRVMKYLSTNYPGNSYMKIYNHNATRENMFEYLKEMVHCENSITIGGLDGKYDYIVNPKYPDRFVQLVKKYYEPVGFPWNSVGEKKITY